MFNNCLQIKNKAELEIIKEILIDNNFYNMCGRARVSPKNKHFDCKYIWLDCFKFQTANWIPDDYNIISLHEFKKIYYIE